MVSLVGEVRLVVVFEAVDPVVVVQIDAKKVLRPVHLKAQKGFFVVGDSVADCAVIVLVEVADEIVVFIPARKDIKIGARLIGPLPVGSTVLVVVVFHELVEKLCRLIVVDIAVGVEQEGAGGVIVIHRESFTEKEPRKLVVGKVHHPGICLSRRVFKGTVVGEQSQVRILAEPLVDVVLAIEVETHDIVGLDGETIDLTAGGKPVVKN